MARRGRGEGSIYQSGGRWVAQVTLPDGRRKAYYGKTRQEVNGKRVKALRDIEQGITAHDDRQTVATYLASWLETIRPRMVEESWRNYEAAVRLHIVPELGKVRLAQLTPQRVQLFYAHAATRRRIAASRVRFLHATLHRALKAAVRLDLVPRNVCDLVDAPPPPPSDVHALSREHARSYLEAAGVERLSALFVLALGTGMRVGELLALRWTEVDLDERKVRVVATLKWRRAAGMPDAALLPVWTPPKTTNSRRQIAIAPQVAAALRTHRQTQRLERIAAGNVWQESGAVFTDEIGRPLKVWHVEGVHRRILARAGVPVVVFHALRHTAATLLLGQNVNPKIVSEMLGHSKVGTTLNIYSHVVPDMLDDAATALADALGW